MSEKPRRGWFRIHLLTVVVLLLVASWFIWLNIIVRGEYIHPYGENSYVPEVHYGFPFIVYRYWPLMMSPDHAWNTNAIPINATFGLTMLAIVGFAFEFFLRRRGAQRTESFGAPLQLHLSTVIALTFVSGLLIWANVYLWQFPYSTYGLDERRLQQAHAVSYFDRLIAILISVACLLGCWMVCEWRIRRHEARKP